MLKYKMLELRPAISPDNIENDDWFYYVISNQFNTITGYKKGKKREIQKYIKETLTRLNQNYALSESSYQHHVRRVSEHTVYM